MIDRVEVSVIEQPQPRWLAFVNREMDIIEQVPEDFTYTAIPNNKVAPNLAKQGIYEVRYLRNDASMSYFAMENPVVGGYTPEKVALRRAIALAVNVDEEIRVVRRGQAIAGAVDHGAGLCAATTRRSAARWAPSTAPRRRRCSISTATSTGTATAGATSPTARRWCSSTRPSPTTSTAS